MIGSFSTRVTVLAAIAAILTACSSPPQTAVLPQTQSARNAQVIAAAGAGTRSFADLLAAQQSCVSPATGVPAGAIVDAKNCVIYVPPVPNFVGWGVATPTPGCDTITEAAIDYLGVVNQYIIDHGGTSLGTTVSGTVSEHRLNDGTAQVDVNIETHNALAWVGCDPNFNFATATVLFGYKAPDVIAGATPAVVDSKLRYTYTEPYLGAPLQDLLFLQNPVAFPLPGYTLKTMQFHASGAGPIRSAFGQPNNTPGRRARSTASLETS